MTARNFRAWLGPQFSNDVGTAVTLLAGTTGHLAFSSRPSLSPFVTPIMPAFNSCLAASLFALTAAASAACRSRDSEARTAGSPASRAESSTARSVPVANDSLSLRADRGRIQGSESARVWVVEVSDFQCPYCRMWHDSSYASLVRD